MNLLVLLKENDLQEGTPKENSCPDSLKILSFH